MSTQFSVSTDIDSTAKLRSSLTSITPIRTREVVKHCGMKFSVIRRKYEIPEETKNFDDYSRLQYSMVFNNIKIPERFEIDKLIEIFSERSIEKYNSDREFQKILNTIEDRSVGVLSPFLDMINLFKSRYKNILDEKIYDYSSSVYETNIPFDILTNFVRSLKMDGLFLNHLDNILNRYNIWLSSNIARSNVRREKMYNDNMKSEINNLFDIAEPMFFNEKCLKVYLIIWNAINYEKFEETEVLDFSDIPKDDFNRIYEGFKNNMKDLRKYIKHSSYGIIKRDRDVIFPELKYDFNNYINSIFISDIYEYSKGNI